MNIELEIEDELIGVTPEEVDGCGADVASHHEQYQHFEENVVSTTKPPTILPPDSATTSLPEYNTPNAVPVISSMII